MNGLSRKLQAGTGRSSEGVCGERFRTLRLAATQVAERIVKYLDCTDEKVSLRAAEDIIEFGEGLYHLEDHERRIQELEHRLRQLQEESGNAIPL
jgi:hypothetical protein